ncbi:MAG: hypothetical protein JW893_04845 [Candidatus Omnitrophica bacterium]|nr:hypothetical protein [Candidatus Omnitrophota bacterium]
MTNFGTTEHVGPFSAQYICFRNIHDWTKVGSLMIHLVPDAVELKETAVWKSHGNDYYTQEFFENLAEKNGCKILAETILIGHQCVCLQKVKDAPFMRDKRSFGRRIVKKWGGLVYLGCNDKGYRQFVNYNPASH